MSFSNPSHLNSKRKIFLVFLTSNLWYKVARTQISILAANLFLCGSRVLFYHLQFKSKEDPYFLRTHLLWKWIFKCLNLRTYVQNAKVNIKHEKSPLNFTSIKLRDAIKKKTCRFKDICPIEFTLPPMNGHMSLNLQVFFIDGVPNQWQLKALWCIKLKA